MPYVIFFLSEAINNKSLHALQVTTGQDFLSYASQFINIQHNCIMSSIVFSGQLEEKNTNVLIQI